jgi:hypothetical protein
MRRVAHRFTFQRTWSIALYHLELSHIPPAVSRRASTLYFTQAGISSWLIPKWWASSWKTVART